MTKNEPLKVIRPAVADGKISAMNMVVSLARSGVPLESIALYNGMTEAERAQIRAALA